MTYLDSVRTAMTILVICTHAAITYGSEGGWYYQEPTTDLLAIVPLTLISAVNQSFFMSLLFFVAAYFTPISFEKKGALPFTVERLKRLGIPLLAFIFGIGPLTLYLTSILDGSEFRYSDSLHVGPLWFVQTLLIFTFAYVVFRLVKRPSSAAHIVIPTVKWLSWLAVIVAALTFLARWAYPIGSGYAGMQFGSFPQYIAMFALGIVAQRRSWFDYIERIRIKPLGVLIVSMIIALPAAMYFGADPEYGFEFFLGGPYWQAIVFAIWESVMCVAMSLFVLAIFRRGSALTSRITTEASASAFSVYVLHPAVLVALSVVMAGLRVHPLMKFALLASLGTAISFVAGSIVRRLPFVRSVL